MLDKRIVTTKTIAQLITLASNGCKSSGFVLARDCMLGYALSTSQFQAMA